MNESKTGDQSAVNYNEGSTTSSVRSSRRKHGSSISEKVRRKFVKSNIDIAEDKSGAVESTLTPNQSMTFSTWRKKNRKVKNKTSKRLIKDMHKVIFPDGKWIRRWDSAILGIIVAYIFYLPFQIGVSGGVFLLKLPWFFGLIVFLNCLLFVDTMLWFRRPFQTSEGKWVIDLKQVKRHYFNTWFIPNMLSNVPATIVFYVLHIGSKDQILRDEQEKNHNTFAIVLVFNVLKLFRIARITKLLGESRAVADFNMRNNSQSVALARYSILIIVLVHWFACIWCWVAYLQNGNFDYSQTNNWIRGWVEESGGGEDAPEPYGANNAWDRYIIALFWASQTITSIGYGNISPQTKIEWWVASFLQLIAGVCWSYVIGGLIAIVAGFNERTEEFGSRSDDAIDLIKAFRKENEVYDDDTEEVVMIGCDEVTKRIRTYIRQQFKHSNCVGCITSLSDNYPILQSLPPELQRQASLLILKGNLDQVSYLSSYYLSPDEQGEVAMRCMQLEFPAGETIDTCVGPENFGRGIYFIQSGSAYSTFKRTKKKTQNLLLTVGSIIGSGRILLEDEHEECRGTSLFFLTYSKVLFIPRTVILESLNEASWRGSGRWIYARTILGHSDVIQAS